MMGVSMGRCYICMEDIPMSHNIIEGHLPARPAVTGLLVQGPRMPATPHPLDTSARGPRRPVERLLELLCHDPPSPHSHAG